jgi:hypothetical protein
MSIRKLITASALIVFSVVNAQSEKVKKMPVFIGCEQFSSNDDLKSCFNQKIGNQIQQEIEFLSNIADYLHMGDSYSKLKFTVSKEGKFINPEVEGINPIFNSFVWSSIIILQSKLDKNGLSLKPGLDQKNKPIDVTLSIPVRFKSDKNQEDYTKFPAENRVLFTVDFEDEIIEIRMNKDFELKTYGNNGERDFYLGKYNNLFELTTVEPYESNINKYFSSSYTPITKGNIDGKEYIIRMKNFFSNNPDDEVLIEVIREEGDTWAEYYSYKTKEEFNQSKFAHLTYR